MIVLISFLFIKSSQIEYKYNIFVDCSEFYSIFFFQEDKNKCSNKLKDYCLNRFNGQIQESNKKNTFSLNIFGPIYVFGNCITRDELKLKSNETIGLVLEFEANSYYMDYLSKNTCKKIGGLDLNLSYLNEINSYIFYCTYKEEN